MHELTDHALVERAAAGGLRAWRPGVQRLPEDDDGPRPVGYAGYWSPHHRDAAPRRPLRPAMARVARDGIGAVAACLHVEEYGAVAAVAGALGVVKRRVWAWQRAGVERAFRTMFYDVIEAAEEERQ
ncbi:MAG: hypothetical protein KAX44_03610 [Candidatus Brocadiae bacterium]|nr:hypothetical protein [Candidatus Brocadiia bacterium]